MNEQDLLRLKRKVDDAKSAVSELKGQQTALMKQLNDEWSCKTVKEAEEKIETMTAEIKQLDKQIEEGIMELQEKYEL